MQIIWIYLKWGIVIKIFYLYCTKYLPLYLGELSGHFDIKYYFTEVGGHDMAVQETMRLNLLEIT